MPLPASPASSARPGSPAAGRTRWTEKPGAASASADLLYAGDPKVYPDLSYSEQLGVEFIQPTNVVRGFFENPSWENAGKYQADLILLDSRTTALQPADLTGNATWAALPAVKADQIVGWNSRPRYSYTAIAPIVQGIATDLQHAKKVA
jgi:iron complex transport system substrate-binding protein